MKVVKDIDLSSFPFWSGAADHADVFTPHEFNQIESALEAFFSDELPSETQINDLFWFDCDWLCNLIGVYKFDIFSSSSSIRDSLEAVIPYIYEHADDLNDITADDLTEVFLDNNTDVESDFESALDDFKYRISDFFDAVLSYFNSEEIKDRSDYIGYSKAEILKDLILNDFDLEADYLS